MEVPNYWIYLINTGLLRAIAGISLGVVLYELLQVSATPNTIKQRLLFTIAELLLFLFCFMAMWKHARSDYDFVNIFCLFGILYLGIGQKTLFSLLFRGKWTKFFRTASEIIYLNHYYWTIFVEKMFNHLSVLEQLAIYIGLIAITSTFVYFIVKLFKLIIKLLHKKKVKTI